METQLSKWNNWSIVTIDGEFVVKHLVRVREQLDVLEKIPNPRIALNLEKMTYIDSSAITLLLNFQKKIVARSGILIIFNVSKDVESIFSIIGIENSIKVYQTRDAFESDAQK